MNSYGFRCKTKGCKAVLKVGDLREDTPRAVYVPVRVDDGPQRFQYQCPDCKQVHDYDFGEVEYFSNS